MKYLLKETFFASMCAALCAQQQVDLNLISLGIGNP